MIYGKLSAEWSVVQLALEGVYSDEVKDMLAYYPGLHQLMPSKSYYDLGGSPYTVVDTLTEAAQSLALPATREVGFDELMGNGGVVDQLFPNPSYNGKTPSQSSREFHAYTANGNSQDDWSSDTTGVRYYRLIGVQGSRDTPQSLREAHGYTALQLRDYAFHPLGPGDGTVPRLSAERIEGELDLNAPNAQLFLHSTGADELLEHTGIMTNPAVIDKVLELLKYEDPEQPTAPPTPTWTPTRTPTPEPADSTPPEVTTLESCDISAGPSAQELGYVVSGRSNVEVPPELRVISVVEYPVEAPQRGRWSIVTVELENVTSGVLSIGDMFISFYNEDGNTASDKGGNMPAYSLGALGRSWALAPGERVTYTGTIPDDSDIAEYRLLGRAGAVNAEISSGPLRILEAVMVASTNQVAAIVKNTGSEPVTLTHIHGTFYDAEGVAMAAGSHHRTVSFRQTIEPGRLDYVGASARSYYNTSYRGPVTSAYVLSIKGYQGAMNKLVSASVSGCADFPSLEIVSQAWSEVMPVRDADKLDSYNGYVYYTSRRWDDGVLSGVFKNAADKRVAIETIVVAPGSLPLRISKKELVS